MLGKLLKTAFFFMITYVGYRLYIVVSDMDLPTSEIPILGDLFIPLCFIASIVGLAYAIYHDEWSNDTETPF